MATSLNFFDGYTFIEHIISFNETHIPNVDDVGVVGVKKKKSFHKRKRNVVDYEGSIFRMRKCCQRSLCAMWV
jgi:hypothetical protein